MKVAVQCSAKRTLHTSLPSFSRACQWTTVVLNIVRVTVKANSLGAKPEVIILQCFQYFPRLCSWYWHTYCDEPTMPAGRHMNKHCSGFMAEPLASCWCNSFFTALMHLRVLPCFCEHFQTFQEMYPVQSIVSPVYKTTILYCHAANIHMFSFVFKGEERQRIILVNQEESSQLSLFLVATRGIAAHKPWSSSSHTDAHDLCRHSKISPVFYKQPASISALSRNDGESFSSKEHRRPWNHAAVTFTHSGDYKDNVHCCCGLLMCCYCTAAIPSTHLNCSSGVLSHGDGWNTERHICGGSIIL